MIEDGDLVVVESLLQVTVLGKVARPATSCAAATALQALAAAGGLAPAPTPAPVTRGGVSLTANLTALTLTHSKPP